MANVVKYVRNRGASSPLKEPPDNGAAYTSLDDTVSVNRLAASATNLASTSTYDGNHKRSGTSDSIAENSNGNNESKMRIILIKNRLILIFI